MSYIEPIDRALEILRARGHKVGVKEASKGPDVEILIPVDGQSRTYKEVLEMAGLTPSK